MGMDWIIQRIRRCIHMLCQCLIGGEGEFIRIELYRELEQRKSVLDGLLPTDGWQVESSVERNLRETGEWIVDQTERRPASAGKSILIAVFKWVLPVWVLMFLVASGAIKLPFGIPFLDDLIR
ncbi:hypothetical protein ACJRO7_012096 [Eucalyptus globulus]|uniref:Uncharacterized protein n=1 Tax=Eucalyptus globulus TaxID=34317 RepID=A0ABD3LID4_EUCGL